ncbi:MAG: CoA ester lyase [Pseudomonadota bacterium]
MAAPRRPALNRTYLFAPGNHPRKVEKVFSAGADVAILDLEDAVAISEKVATRGAVVEALKGPRACRGYVRVNAFDTDYCYGDIAAVAGGWADGVVLPKVEGPDALVAVDWMLGALERDRGLTPGALDLVPIIETAKGMAGLRDIVQAETRVRRVAFGAGDYTTDLNLSWSFEETELAAARAELVLASRLAGLEPPIDTVFIHIREHDAFAASAARGRALGFQGKLCIHPDQVAPTNAAYSPSKDEIAYAERIKAAFEDAEARGSASIQVDGYFVDYPIVEKALRTVALADAVAAAEAN